jgi:hypothetical protein
MSLFWFGIIAPIMPVIRGNRNSKGDACSPIGSRGFESGMPMSAYFFLKRPDAIC